MGIKARILVVEDNCSHSESIMEILKENGYLAECTFNGKDAVERAGDSKYDIAIVDINLPDISGNEVAERITEISPSTEFIYMTGNATINSTIEAVKQKNVVSYETKPLDMNHLLSLINQVVERKKAEEELHQHGHIVSCSRDMMAFMDKDFLYVAANPAYLDAFNKSHEELIGHSGFEVFGEEFFGTAIKPRAELCLAGEVVNYQVWMDFPKYGKRYMDVTYYPYTDESNIITGFVVNGRDITNRKHNERYALSINSLNQNLISSGTLEEKLSLITDSVVDIFNADLCRIWITRRGDKCDTGCIRAEEKDGPHVCVQRDRCLHLVASSGRYTHIDGKMHSRVPFGCYKIGKITAGDDPTYISNDILNDRFIHDKEWARKLGLVSFACFRLLTSDAEPIGVLAVFSKTSISSNNGIFLEGIANSASKIIQFSNAEDVRKEMERALLQSEKLKSIGTITAGISHEFNNILAIISGNIQLLEEDYKDNKELMDILRIINKASDDGAEISSNMLKFAKTENDTNRFVPANIKGIISQSIDFAKPRWKNEAQAKGINYKVDTEGMEKVPAILCNPAELREVFINIINNALEAMPEGGGLTFTTRSDGDTVFTSVSDTGVGISESVKKRIFDPFFTTRTPVGTGLGMSTAYGIIIRHGGSIEVESEEGKGATFNISIPINSDSTQQKPSAKPVNQEITANKLCVLVVDDSEEMCVVMDNFLTMRGHTVTVVNGGAEAIELAGKKDFDLVLCDLSMPDVYGYDVIEALNKLEKRPKTGIMTGWNEKLKPIDDEVYKVDFIIKKPFKHAELAMRINSLFN